jgi:plastocyanin
MSRFQVRTLTLVVTAIGGVSLACGGGSSGPPAPTLTIAKTSATSGDGQTDTVLSTLANPIRVVVTLGTPQVGTTVTWAAAGPGASVTPLQSMTDVNGIATTTWKLGHVAGAQTATASVSGASGSPVTFTATATPGVPTQMIQPTGDGQAWMIGTVLPQKLGVTVADQYGNGVAGTAVAWQVTSGSASVNPTNPTSNASGVAQTSLTLGNTPGPITITATNASLSGSPQTFNATAQAIPTSAAVTVGPGIQFKSNRNSSTDPATDTIAVGGSVTWTWAANSIGHSVHSTGAPAFTSSIVMISGSYAFTFNTAGTYQYNCAVHGSSMAGTIVVR